MCLIKKLNLEHKLKKLLHLMIMIESYISESQNKNLCFRNELEK
jgi:hypothetical protein